jgi:hypothetical protein
MNKQLAEAFARAKESVFPEKDRHALPAFGLLGLACMVLSAFLFAVDDYGKVNVLLAFIVAFFTGGAPRADILVRRNERRFGPTATHYNAEKQRDFSSSDHREVPNRPAIGDVVSFIALQGA